MIFSVLFLLSLLPGIVEGSQLTGYAGMESRLFPNEPVFPVQHGHSLSFAFEGEYYHEWSKGRQNIAIVPFFRYDGSDDERTHFDIRELYWHMVSDIWELRVGIRKIFWGVTEAHHLVDIINQTDLVENIDTEDKLGQPMINFALIRRWGTLDFFMLPGFRERTFPGIKGRLRSSTGIARDSPVYESSAEYKHLDWAVRWSHVFNDFDFGLYHFYGTSRNPRFVPGTSGEGKVVLRPYYDLIHQTGLDVQVTRGGWLWKLEAISRSGQEESYYSATGGFEYTFVNVRGTGADIGMLSEYIFDERRERAPVMFEDDIFAAIRVTLNDVQDSAVLAGLIIDRETGGTMLNIEAGRRIRENWRLSVEVRGFSGIHSGDLLFDVRDDDYVQLELTRHF